jgi:replicative DNA helicase Mcm
MILCDESRLSRWMSFFEDNFKPEIETLATKYPEEKSLLIDYWVFDKVNHELLQEFIDNPVSQLFHADSALRQIDTVIGKMEEAHFSIINLPNKLQIGLMRATHIGKYLSIDGLIKKRTEVRPICTNAAFQCQKCGAVIRVEQHDDSIREPVECYEDQGGCGRKTSFDFNDSLSHFIDGQRLEIQEKLEDLKGGAQPEKLVVDVREELVGKVLPGDIVVINGIAVRHKRKKGSDVSTTFGKMITANSIEIKEKSFEDVEVSPEDEKKILAASKDPMLYSNMMQSIAPSIFGMEIEKTALMLQLFGGVAKELPDARIRGDIHILLIGDPGIAKSQLLSYMSKIAPRSIFCDGKGASAAGLTASAVRDALSEGQWTLEAGALVLADGGIVCVDEIDKMDEHDRESLHSAMEQQVVRVDKAGIHATLRTRCALLAAANPKMGRFDRFMSIVEQINLPVSLMSRFDLIFALYDTGDKKHDELLAAHIGGVHQKKATSINTAIYPQEFITKYVAYAKRFKPELTDESVETVNQFYLHLRASAAEGSVAITPRQLEALYRLSEASAKVRLAAKVTIDDAQRAIKIFEEYLHRVGVDHETGQFDIDIIQSGISHSQHERMRGIIDLIRGLDDGTGARIDELITTLEIRGIDRKKAEEAIEKLKENRSIYEPGFGRLKVV